MKKDSELGRPICEERSFQAEETASRNAQEKKKKKKVLRCDNNVVINPHEYIFFYFKKYPQGMGFLCHLMDFILCF